MPMHELLFHLKFQITGNELSKKNGDILIRQFRSKLDNFKLEKGSLEATVDVPENIDFMGASFVNDHLIEGHYRNINVHAIDNCQEGERAQRLNTVIKAEIAKRLEALKEDRYNAELRVIEVDYL